MAFASGEHSTPYDALKKAREHVLLIIDPNEARAQSVARLLTLTGLRAIVTLTTLQAFDRFLKERFMPRLIFVGRQEEIASTIFSRFFQRLIQELRYEVPVLPLAPYALTDGLPSIADASVSTTVHVISQQHAMLLQAIWQILPSAQVPLKVADHTLVMEALPRLGFTPRVTRNKHSYASHYYGELKAAKKVIAPEQWDILLSDVGLAQYCKEENWPANTDELMVSPEDFALLTRAVMFSNPQQPLQHARNWADMVDDEMARKAFLLFMVQQMPKIIGEDRTIRALLNLLISEINKRRGEELAEWKRMKDGSFIFVFYSNLFTYGLLVDSKQPLCIMWESDFDFILKQTKLQSHWEMREIECSSQTHTGHCVFQVSPKRTGR